MAKLLTVSEVHVASRTGPNKAPSSGAVTFSDGKQYGFIQDLEQDADGVWRNVGWVFFSSRKRHSINERVSFNSPKRAALLQAEFDK